MEKFWVIIFVSFFASNSLGKAESVELEELPLQTFDELFVEEWWDKDDAEDSNTPAATNFGQNVPHQIDRQNTQIGQIESNPTDQNAPLTESDHSGQIEPNSTDQNPPLTESDHSGQIEPNSTNQNPPLTESDHSGQIEPNSTDQNPPLTESDHSDNDKNGEEISSYKNIAGDEQKLKIIDEFHAIKDKFKQKRKIPTKERVRIEETIGKHLKVNRKKIYEWKKEFGLAQINPKNERKNLVEKFDQMKAELMRDGLKNSYKNQIDEIVAKELGLCFGTIYNWKRELGQTKPNKYSHNEQKDLMKLYYEIKDQNPKRSDKEIAKMLKIARDTLVRWKKQFNRQQSGPNSVEENAAANVQEIKNSNSESI